MKTLSLFLLTVSLAPLAASTTLILTPADIGAGAGDITGWNFSLLNDGAGYLSPTAVSFTVDNGVFTGFLPASPADVWLLQSFLPIGPGQTLAQTFNAAAHQGIGPFTINDFQPFGDLSTGDLQITYDYYATDPNAAGFDPDNPDHQYGQQVSARASVGVLAPEPSSLLPFCLGMGVIVAGLRRRR